LINDLCWITQGLLENWEKLIFDRRWGKAAK